MKKPLSWIRNYFGNKFYPYTHSDAVYIDNEEQKSLSTELSEIKNKTDNISKIQSDLNEHVNILVKDLSSDVSNGTITVTRFDNSVFTINIPKSLIFQSATFNESTNEIVIIWSDGSDSHIPVGELVDIYTGSESNSIKITVNENNVISAVIKEQGITKNFLSPDIQADLNHSHIHDNIDVLNGISNETLSNIQAFHEHALNEEKHIPCDGTSGQVIGMTDDGIKWVDAATIPENYITNDDFATENKLGLVKPDGYTIVCNEDGTINTQYIKTINITSGADLDTILSPGFYCCQTTAIAASLLNCPVNTPFSLTVKYATGMIRNSAIQELTTYIVNNPKTYKRSIYHNDNGSQHATGEWYLVYDENNKPPINSTTAYYSIADLGMDTGVKHTTMNIFDNLPSKSILYLGDCANVSDPPDFIDNPSITIYKIMGTACYAIAVSRKLTDMRLAYKIFRSNDPKGDSGWTRLYTEADKPVTTTSLLATETGTPLDATVAPIITGMIASQNTVLTNSVAEINSNLASKQDAKTSINTSNIGAQSVNYANSAGSVPWTGVVGRPSLLNAVTTANTQTKQITVAASSIISVDLPFTAPDGFLPIGVIAVNSNTASSAITRFMLNGSNVRVELRNMTAGQQTITISAVVLCKNNGA